MVIVKTKMSKIPASCKECELVLHKMDVWVCPLLKNWLEQWQIDNGKVKQDDCPLMEQS